jgi:hypothetical protein
MDMENEFNKNELINLMNYWYYDEKYQISIDKSKEIINNNFIQDKYNWEDIESINDKVYKTLLPYTNIIIQNSGADAD